MTDRELWEQEAMGTSRLTIDEDSYSILCEAASKSVSRQLFHLRDRPVFTLMPDEIFQAILRQRLPDTGLPPEAILALCEEWIMPYSKGNGHPRYAAWVNSAPAPLAVVAEFLVAALNIYASGGAHAATVVEHRVVRWLIELVGLPSSHAAGLLTSGGSMATLIALNAARYHYCFRDGWNVRERGNLPNLTLYASDQAHSCLRRAIEVMGLGSAALRSVPTDGQFRIDIHHLRKMVEEDLDEGKRPFCIIGNAGTTNTGAIDCLASLADICDEYGMWLHIDGAYGAIGRMDPRIRDSFMGIERADSLVVDPHKWLAVPVGCGCVLVRDERVLFEAFNMAPEYLRTHREHDGYGGVLPWPSDYGIELSRRFSALSLWMVLLQLGKQGVRSLVSHHNDRARNLSRLIADDQDFELMAPITLSIVCFRFAPAALRGNVDRLNTINEELVNAIQVGGEAFLAGTMLHDTYVLRCCIVHHDVSEADIAALFNAVRLTAARIVSAHA